MSVDFAFFFHDVPVITGSSTQSDIVSSFVTALRAHRLVL